MSSLPQMSHVRKLRDNLINLVVTNSMGREFIPCDTFESLMEPETISLVFQEIVTTNAGQYHMLDYKNNIQRVVEKLPKILAILVWLGKENLILSFLRHSRDDSNLPLNIEDLKMIDPSLEQTRFREMQFCFIAIRFTKGEERHWHKDHILPFLAEGPLRGGEGGFGVVYEVKIHSAYHNMWLFLEGEEHVFARKELIPDDCNDKTFEMEKSAFATLQAKCEHPNIVPLLACYKHGEKYNLIFPKADSDLHKYFHESPKPEGDLEIFNLMEQISGLASALDKIHNCDISFDLGGRRVDLSQIGYHRDLKPKNILKKGNVFMISDFGLARFKRMTSRSEVEWDMGESTYFAPECKRGAKVGRRADIWSLGCIFSEVVTFALLGKEGIQEFSAKRGRPADFGSDFTLDIFHDGKRLNPEALKWFELLRAVSGSKFISSILDLVEEMLSAGPEDRPEAKDVPPRFKDILLREEERIQPTREVASVESDRSSLQSPIRIPMKSMPFFTSPDAPPRDLPDLGNAPPSRILEGLWARRNSIINHPGFKPTDLQAIRESINRQAIRESVNRQAIRDSVNRLSISRERSFSEQDLKKPKARTQPRPASTPMHRHTSSEPKVVVPSPKPLLYKVVGFLDGPGRSNSGKNPFEYLGKFDTVFLIDDSHSMIPAWNSVAVALFRFLGLAIAYDPDGVDLYFMSSDVSLRDAKDGAAVFTAFQNVQPQGSTFMNLKLEKLLTDYVQRFKADREGTKMLNLIVITDGDILSIGSPEPAIVSCAQQLDAALAPSCQVGVQFVLIGSREEARWTFQDMDDNLGKRNDTRDMVDVTVYDPDMDGRGDETLLKIMCGAVNRVLDAGRL